MKQPSTGTGKKLACVAVLLLLAGCCGGNNVPVRLSTLRFMKSPPAARLDTMPAFRRVHAIGGNGNLADSTRRFITALPMTLVADQTTYIFQSANRTDTLTISYRRRLEFISRICGAEMRLDNFRLSQPTTFKKATVSEYDIQITL